MNYPEPTGPDPVLSNGSPDEPVLPGLGLPEPVLPGLRLPEPGLAESGPARPQYRERSIAFNPGQAFFNPKNQFVRDLGVLAAAVHRETQGSLRILETMAGSGVRALRYGMEAGAEALWINEGNPDLGELLTANLQPVVEKLGDRLHLSQENAIQILAQALALGQTYDLVDIDAFGAGTEYFSLGLQVTAPGGLLYVTATDGRALGGHDPDRCLQRYGTFGRAHPSHSEQGLRIVIGNLAQTAAQLGFGVTPVLATYTGQTYRVMVRRSTKRLPLVHSYGFLGYCHRCGTYQAMPWRKLGQPVCGQHSPPQPLTLTGPLWLGALHDRSLLPRLITQAKTWEWLDCLKKLEIMEQEAELPPYHFTLGEIGKRGAIDPPPRDRLLAQLHRAGYAASPLHWNPQAIKTTAPIATCIALSCSGRSRELSDYSE